MYGSVTTCGQMIYLLSERMTTSMNCRLSECSRDVIATAQAINSPLRRLCHLSDGHLAHLPCTINKIRTQQVDEKHVIESTFRESFFFCLQSTTRRRCLHLSHELLVRVLRFTENIRNSELGPASDRWWRCYC